MRSCLPVEESREEFNGSLASQQVIFIIVEVVIILISCVSLTIAQAGLLLERAWNVAKTNYAIAESTQTPSDEKGSRAEMKKY